VPGWACIELDQIDDEELAMRLTEAWRLIAPNDFKASLVCPAGNFDNGAKLPNIARVETIFVYALSAGENGR
jgi:hypothetical protein